jgi:hypothetical protein
MRTRAAVLDAFGFGMTDDQAVDVRPGLGRDPLDVVGERRLPRNFEGMCEAAEAHKAAGVGEVERELLVAEAVHLLDESSVQHLLGREPGASRTLGPIPAQVFNKGSNGSTLGGFRRGIMARVSSHDNSG